MVLRNQSYINLSGPPVTLTLRNAPARDALMAIAQIGGYGFVYVDPEPEPEKSQRGRAALSPGSAGADPKNVARQFPVSLSFRNESYAKALNSVLLASGLQARREGTIILAGPNVQGKTFGPQLSKIYRLNQASAASAADYLASLGAEITKVTVISSTSLVGLNQSQGASAVGGAPAQQGQASSQVSGAYSQQTQSGQLASAQTYGGGAGPLRGLAGTTDSRLQTITLIGEARLVAVAENYLRQLDLRQRQVALSVRILDVTLDNDSDIKNSFAYRYGNNFIVNDEGRLVATFNSQTPPGTIAGSGLPRPTFGEIASGSYSESSGGSATRGLVQQPTAINPGRFYSPNNFYDLVRASIQSRSTKVLASPTLILSESPDEIAGGQEVVAELVSNGGQTVSSSSAIGRPRANEGFVTVGEQVITNYSVTVGTAGNGNSCQPEFGIAGLTFGARVSRVDDNGFVTFTLSPQITAKTREQQVAGCGPIDILSIRRLDTGSSRVRDGQTLILTGVISDVDNQEVSKWPILGDIPLIGQFFRGSSGQRKKRELVIMVTPRILDDQQGGTYGYGYQPATADAQRFMAN
jgi:type IV pilus assembly protein PilQ